MDRRSLIVLGIAVVIGLFAVYIANSWFSGREQQQVQREEAQEVVQVVVASQDLAFGTPLDDDTIRLVDWPADSMPSGAVTAIERINNGSNVAIRPIAAGEPVLISRISDRAILSANIPDDMRAMTVPIDAVSGVAGFIFPGDVVDVFLTRQIPGDGAESHDQMVTVVQENVQVLAVEQRASENDTQPAVGSNATLLVDQFQAQKLTLATQIGRLTMTLRNVEDQEVGATRIATTRDLAGSGYYIPERNRDHSQSSPATQSAPAANRPTGPTMVIYRGTEATRQEVLTDGSN